MSSGQQTSVTFTLDTSGQPRYIANSVNLVSGTVSATFSIEGTVPSSANVAVLGLTYATGESPVLLGWTWNGGTSPNTQSISVSQYFDALVFIGSWVSSGDTTIEVATSFSGGGFTFDSGLYQQA